MSSVGSQSQGTTGRFKLLEFKDGAPTGWEHTFNNKEVAERRALRLNNGDTGCKYLVEEITSAAPQPTTFTKTGLCELVYKKTVIGIAMARLPLPGVVIKDQCPKCKRNREFDLSDYPVSFPTTNAPFDFDAYCIDCSAEWKIPIMIELTVRLPNPRDYEESREHEKTLAALQQHTDEGPCSCKVCQEQAFEAETKPPQGALEDRMGMDFDSFDEVDETDEDDEAEEDDLDD